MRLARPDFAFALPLTAAATLVGCAGGGEATQVTSYVTQTLTGSNVEDATSQGAAASAGPGESDAAFAAYPEILDNPGQDSFTGGADYPLSGEYQYALVGVTGDGFPELLLQAMSAEPINPIRGFRTSDDGSLVSPEDTLFSGAAAGSWLPSRCPRRS